MRGIGAHTVKAFDEDLEDLRARVAELGGCAEAALREAMEALLRIDAALADAALERAARARGLAEEVERRGACVLALRAPVGDDLREVLSAIKLASLLDRVAEHAGNIAATVGELDFARPIGSPLTLGALARLALEAVRRALDAYAARDTEAVHEAAEASRTAHGHYVGLLQESLCRMRRDPDSIASATGLLFVARSLWRISEQGAAIARTVRFAVTGQPLPALGPAALAARA